MKKYIFVGGIILLAVVVCIWYGQYIAGPKIKASDFYVGMSGEEMMDILEKTKYDGTSGYYCFLDANHKNVVLHTDSSAGAWQVREIWTFDPAVANEERLSLIQEGMTFPEVVSILGLPDEANPFSGLVASKYQLKNGKYALVYWSGGVVYACGVYNNE